MAIFSATAPEPNSTAHEPPICFDSPANTVGKSSASLC